MIEIIVTVIIYLGGVCLGFNIGYDIGYDRGRKKANERIDEILRGDKHDD